MPFVKGGELYQIF
jgi:serine/threonine protein kinase